MRQNILRCLGLSRYKPAPAVKPDTQIEEINSFSVSMKNNRFHSKDIVSILNRLIGKEQSV